MGTKDFNLLDLFICRWRSKQVRRFVKKGDKILDFGCGHQALFLRSVETLVESGVGIDYDATSAKIAPNLEIKNTHFKDRLEFPDKTFNCIVILAVLEHIPLEMITPLLSEFRRILKDDGVVLVTTPTPASKPVLEFMAFKLRIISQPEIADHKHYYSKSDIFHLATAHKMKCTVYKTFQLGLNSFSVLAKT